MNSGRPTCRQVFAKAGIPRRKPPQNAGLRQCRRAGRRAAPHHLALARRELCAAAGAAGSPDHRPFRRHRCRCAHALLVRRTMTFSGSSKPGEPLFWQPASAGSYRCGRWTITAAATSGPWKFG